jgi:hypothetical protein
MEAHIKWWNSLPYWRKKKLAYDEQWTTVEQISNHQIKMIYDSTQNY